MPEKLFVVAAVGDEGPEPVDSTQDYHTANNEEGQFSFGLICQDLWLIAPQSFTGLFSFFRQQTMDIKRKHEVEREMKGRGWR